MKGLHDLGEDLEAKGRRMLNGNGKEPVSSSLGLFSFGVLLLIGALWYFTDAGTAMAVGGISFIVVAAALRAQGK